MSQALGLLLYQNMFYLKKPSRPPPIRKRDFRSFLVKSSCMYALFARACACTKCHVYHAFRPLLQCARFLCARLRGDGAFLLYYTAPSPIVFATPCMYIYMFRTSTWEHLNLSPFFLADPYISLVYSDSGKSPRPKTLN